MRRGVERDTELRRGVEGDTEEWSRWRYRVEEGSRRYRRGE